MASHETYWTEATQQILNSIDHSCRKCRSRIELGRRVQILSSNHKIERQVIACSLCEKEEESK